MPEKPKIEKTEEEAQLSSTINLLASELERLKTQISELKTEKGSSKSIRKNSYLVQPPKKINDMILLEWDSWRIKELQARLAKTTDADDLLMYPIVILKTKKKFIKDYEGTMKSVPAIITKEFTAEYELYCKEFAPPKR